VTILGPSLDWREDAFGHTEHPVNVAVDLLRACIAPDGERPTIGGRQAHGHDLVSGKLAAQGLPGSVDTLLQEGALNTDGLPVAMERKVALSLG
jgi:hypothetical protein